MARPIGEGIGNGVRLALKQVVMAGLAVSDRLQGGVGEARAQLTSLVAEARAEQHAAHVTREQATSGATVRDIAVAEASSPSLNHPKGQNSAASR
jgi:hypothetical protein